MVDKAKFPATGVLQDLSRYIRVLLKADLEIVWQNKSATRNDRATAIILRGNTVF